jgi:SAM-dependent methyltransferase
MLNKLRRAIRTRIVKRWGWTRAKRFLWDEEFARGQWNYLEHTKGDPVYGFIEKYSENGRVLDLGCGSGNTGNELEYKKYERYVGTDISIVAIDKAKIRTQKNAREGKNEYVCAAIETYVPKEKYNVILFRESIFYVAIGKIKKVIDRYCNYLTDDGVIIVRMCDRDKYKAILNVITKHYRVIERYRVNEAKDVIIIFVRATGHSN